MLGADQATIGAQAEPGVEQARRRPQWLSWPPREVGARADPGRRPAVPLRRPVPAKRRRRGRRTRPCEIAPPDPSYTTNRPRHRGIRATINGKTSRRATMTYHLTWVAEYGLIPSGNGGARLEFSHRCHQSCCINPKHGGWELPGLNKAREQCRPERGGSHTIGEGGGSVLRCPHGTPCLSVAE